MNQWTGPLYPETCAANALGANPGGNNAFKMIVWVRDPVTRVISSWNFLRSSHTGTDAHKGWRKLIRYSAKLGVNVTHGAPQVRGSGFAEVMAAARAIDGVVKLLCQIGHVGSTLARYLFQGDQSMVAAGRLQFAGRLENYDEDFSRLLELLGLRQDGRGRADSVNTASEGVHLHKTARGGSPLTAADVLAMRQSLTMSYAAMWWLESGGLLPGGYYHNITSQMYYAD